MIRVRVLNDTRVSQKSIEEVSLGVNARELSDATLKKPIGCPC